jgi:uncharacterized protein YigE (DUF2233 family)
MRARTNSGKIVASSLIASAACVVLAVIAAVLSWPRLLVPLFGLESQGSLASALPAAPVPMSLDAAPLQNLDSIDFLLAPSVGEPTLLEPSEFEGASFAGESSTPGATNYLLMLDQSAVNGFANRYLRDQDTSGTRYRDVWIDLQPGGMILFADVNLGLHWQRAGLLFVQDGLSLRAERIVLDDESYALPESGLLSEWVASAAIHPQRVVEQLVVTGPLQGEAHVQDLRIYSDRVEIWARATYPVPPSPDTGWMSQEEGVDLRQMDVVAAYGTERATLVRLDPAAVQFLVRYDPDNPRRLSAWAAETDALLVVNGGYFNPDNEAIGIVVSNGQRWGSTLGDYAGMFAVTADQQVSVRWLGASPFDPVEPLAEAVQSFPVLVKPGGLMGFPAGADDGTPERRTVVAQDRAGRIVVVVAPGGLLSLHDMAVFLASADLDIDVALNLDGGASTGIWLAAGEREVRVDSGVALPVVMLVERR